MICRGFGIPVLTVCSSRTCTKDSGTSLGPRPLVSGPRRGPERLKHVQSSARSYGDEGYYGGRWVQGSDSASPEGLRRGRERGPFYVDVLSVEPKVLGGGVGFERNAGEA